MADDLLLNFAIPPPSTPAANPRKRKLQDSARQSQPKQTSVTTNNARNYVQHNSKPALPDGRRTPSNDFSKRTPVRNDQRARFPRKFGETKQKRPQKKQQFVSSLFTSNAEVPKAQPPTKPTTTLKATPVFSASTFAELGLHTALCANLRAKHNLTAPTRIQRTAISALLTSPGRDVVVKAETGSGKTLAFVLPIIHKMLRAEEESREQGVDPRAFGRDLGTLGLIIAPTRELAKQISEVVESVTRISRRESKVRHWIVPGSITGGEKKKSEKARLRKGINILVCTPGRLLDHLEHTESFGLGNLRWLVLDEADRLMELGFQEPIKKILTIVKGSMAKAKSNGSRIDVPQWPEELQVVLCSATMQGTVKEFSEHVLTNPQFVVPTTQSQSNAKMSIPQQLHQQCVLVPEKLRLVVLTAYLLSFLDASKSNCKIIVFVSTCDSVDFHHHLFVNAHLAPARFVEGEDSDDDSNKEKSKPSGQIKPPNSNTSVLLRNVPFFKLHGDLPQAERTKVHSLFKASTRGILVCTDVAARGLDLPDITSIVQYDPPTDVGDYVHRVGRTARIGKRGDAVTFLLPSESDYLKLLRTEYNFVVSEKAYEGLLKTLVARPIDEKIIPLTTKRGGKKSVENAATDLQMVFERYVAAEASASELARAAFRSHIRAYSTHPPKMRSIFHIKRIHLGHLAKAFGLREAPNMVIKGIPAAPAKVDAERDSKRLFRKNAQNVTKRAANEFDDGVVSKKRKTAK
ncbi:P-loop containing nucleoside triphosphate hydrolase protein [Cladochytrium replicatum]|nr:P-loop containing nucleoside triphosphate hydrolase protein [Cladochytrium replicatum]